LRLLDLFCGAGGAAVGYRQAGFEVVGVDVKPQPNYPFVFHEADAMTFDLDGFDVIHASPPCQAYSPSTPNASAHPDLYEPMRERLVAHGVPYVIENVPGAPFRSGALLCGSAFGLKVRRHRNFESSLWLASSGCFHAQQGAALGIYGNGGAGLFHRPSGGGGQKAHRKDFAKLMGMPWATPAEIVEAIPPAYTDFIGQQLLAALADV